jgi:hypothetical protein
MIRLDLSILNQKGTPMFYSDTLALRPAFGIVGRIFIAIDSPYGIFRDTGTAWDQIAGSGGAGITGTGTATQIAYFIGASSISSSSNLFWDNTNSRLGINTATPSSSLDVHSAVQSVIHANNTTLGNSFFSFQLQGTGKWQIGNVYNAGDNYFRIQDQLNSLERFTIRNTGQIDFLGYTQILNNVTGITGTSPSALPNNYYSNNFTYNSGITTVASVNTIGLDVDNSLNYSGANTINSTSYNTTSLLRNLLTFGSAAASITYTQATGIRALVNNQLQYFQSGANSGTISHYANINILGDNKNGAGLTTFTNRYGLLINDYNEFTAGNTYTNRWGIYQAGANENNFFNGKVGIGSGYTPSAYNLEVLNSQRITGSLPSLTIQSTGSGINASSTLFMYSNSFTGYGIFRAVDANDTNFNALIRGKMTYVMPFGGIFTTNIAASISTVDICLQMFTSKSVSINSAGVEYASAQLAIDSTNKGFLPPRMTTALKNLIATPSAGLLIYDTSLNKLCVFTTAWETITSI